MSEFASLPKSADEMISEARRLSDIDIIDDSAREPLNRLVESLNSDAKFSAEGALAKHAYLMRFLINRLRMKRDFLLHPEINDIVLKPPVVISAMGRTGSTKLQKVLAATGEFNWLSLWKALNPSSFTGVPNEDSIPRIQDAQQFIDWFLTQSPLANAGHRMAVDEPEEESYLMMHSLISQTMSGYANADSYLDWYMTQDHQIQFKYVMDFLKYLVWQGLADPDKPFVLKSAMSIGYEEALSTAFSRPKMITTHRDPKNVVPSSCKLIEVFRKPYSDAPVDHSGLLPAMAFMIGRYIEFRRNRPDVSYYDVDYRDLHKDAAAVVEKIFAYAGIKPNAGALQNVHDWEKNNPRHADGGFNYTFEEFDLSASSIDAAFADYIEFTRRQGIDFSEQ